MTHGEKDGWTFDRHGVSYLNSRRKGDRTRLYWYVGWEIPASVLICAALIGWIIRH